PVADLAAEAARYRLGRLGIQGSLRVRAVGSVASRVDVDQPGIDRCQVAVTEPQLVRPPGPESGNEDVGLPDDPARGRLAFGAAQVYGHAFLTLCGLQGRHFRAERHPVRVTGPVLDLDDPGAQSRGHGQAVRGGVV